MIKYLVLRPVAILVIFCSLVIVGALLIFEVPVSLLPAIDVPKIQIKVNMPNSSAREIEEGVLKPIREQLSTMDNLVNLSSDATNHQGNVDLEFRYGSNMSLAYIEVNEKIDRLTGRFPAGIERPQINRINTSDIPVIRLQVLPRSARAFTKISQLTLNVLKRRLEQIPGISLVDISGQRELSILVSLKADRMAALGVDVQEVQRAIQSANSDPGGLTLTEGQYRFFIRIDSRVKSIDQLKEILVSTSAAGKVPLEQVADLTQEISEITGYHLYNGKEGLVVTLQGQPSSRMNELIPLVKTTVNDFIKQYPDIDFALSQDQSFLLEAGIDNLYQDIILGGVLTIALLFLFLGNWASPLLMSISIPISLLLTVIFFYFFKISFNIISLSGIALGIGMLIDNSIVVIGHITRKRIEGHSLLESAARGTEEMAIPVISQVVTTVVVYAPLAILSGLAGALIGDQSIALTISLGVSLLVAFVLTPVLYKQFLTTPAEKLKQDTVFYTWVSRHYHRMIDYILHHQRIFMAVTLALMPLGIILAFFVPFEGLPKIEKKESLVKISWNEPLSLQENLKRTKILLDQIQRQILQSEAEVGRAQFLFQQDNGGPYQSQIYYSCVSERMKERVDTQVKHALAIYSGSKLTVLDAPNAFTQLFSHQKPFVEVKFKSFRSNADGKFTELEDWLQNQHIFKFSFDASMSQEPAMLASLDINKMNIYGVSRPEIDRQLQLIYRRQGISEMSGTENNESILLTEGAGNLDTRVISTNGASYPLSEFVHLRKVENFSHISADKDGVYRSILLPKQKNIDEVIKRIRVQAANLGYSISLQGSYYENKELIRQMVIIFLIVLLLLYAVLALQFESLLQPLVVMLTIPLGITGAMPLLMLSGGSFNVMSAIGFVVVLGLIVDDPLLKIETMNRLRQDYDNRGIPWNKELLHSMVHQAGEICLKPLLMVSLTTSIALLPLLFIGGIGNDLQRPMALVIIGGLTIGTFFTTWFIPLAYLQLLKWTKKIS